MSRAVATPWQTLGPYFDPRLLRPGDADLTRRRPGGPVAEGEAIEIAGTVCIRRGEPDVLDLQVNPLTDVGAGIVARLAKRIAIERREVEVSLLEGETHRGEERGRARG